MEVRHFKALEDCGAHRRRHVEKMHGIQRDNVNVGIRLCKIRRDWGEVQEALARDEQSQ